MKYNISAKQDYTNIKNIILLFWKISFLFWIQRLLFIFYILHSNWLVEVRYLNPKDHIKQLKENINGIKIIKVPSIFLIFSCSFRFVLFNFYIQIDLLRYNTWIQKIILNNRKHKGIKIIKAPSNFLIFSCSFGFEISVRSSTILVRNLTRNKT